MVAPEEFITAAEETGLIAQIGYWVLRQACADLRSWQLLHPSVSDVRIAVNLSVRQLAISDLAVQVEKIVTDAGLRPGRVELEITESSVMTDTDQAAKTLEQLKARGFRLSIDDFGTGHSSLSYVHRFPLDRIKVDKSFLMRVRTEKETDVVFRAIVDIGEQLGLDVVAEGIETRAEVAQLQAINCKLGQGYLFSAPEPSAIIAERLMRDADPQLRGGTRGPGVLGLRAKST
jgi:EAL domain-containing protein (putative c-di-GMP-specific phosphodiesterase class I)